MKELAATILLLAFFSITYSQQEILIFKKKNNSVEKFWKGSVISFQVSSNQWRKGEITRIHNDSFYIRPAMVIYKLLGMDSVYFPIQGYSIDDIYAMPKKGVLVSYKNGSYQISRSGGHVHWYWIKSGLLFRLAGAGYAVLNIANGNAFGVAVGAAAFLGGFIMGKLYKPVLSIGRKYRVVTFRLDNNKVVAKAE